MELDEYELGARIKRVFTAFLVSNFVSPVQVWLGMEYKKLAIDLDAYGAQHGSSAGNLPRASALFKKASRLTFALFALGLSMMVIEYVAIYGIEFSMLGLGFSSGSSLYPNPSMYLSELLDVLVIAFLFAITSSIFSFVTNITLRDAWTLVLSHFVANDHGSYWMPAATKQVERVIKGTKKSIVSSGLSLITSFVLIIFFSTLFPFIMSLYNPYNYMYTTMIDYTYAYAILGIVSLVLAVIGMVFGLQGTINQGIGLFDLAKALQGNGVLHGIQGGYGGQRGISLPPSRRIDQQAREIPMPVHADEQRFCAACGFRVLPQWSAMYCPNCGARLI